MSGSSRRSVLGPSLAPLVAGALLLAGCHRGASHPPIDVGTSPKALAEGGAPPPPCCAQPLYVGCTPDVTSVAPELVIEPAGGGPPIVKTKGVQWQGALRYAKVDASRIGKGTEVRARLLDTGAVLCEGTFELGD